VRRAVLVALACAPALLVAAIGAAGLRRPAPPAPPAAAPAAQGATGIFGFLPGSVARQKEIEALLLSLPDAKRVDDHARFLTEDPHVAGTPENEAVARYIEQRFKEAGLETGTKTYRVYLGYVKSALLEQVEPEPKRLTNPEEGVPDDKDAADPRAALTWNAYSPSCDLTREAVYVNYARKEDFDSLDRLGVSVKDRLVLARYFNGYRGGKAQEAQRRGAAGIVFFSDPMEDGYFRGDVYPRGPWGPDGHVQRGAVVYDYIVPGDPLTPGWPSLPGAKRIKPADSEILPRIPSVPISGRDALVVLRNLAGPTVPDGWQGALPVTYHVGPGPSRLHLKIDASFETRPITDVIGVLRGSDEPERQIVLGNHHDAWVYGAVDPSSGTATMLELARVAGELKKRGHPPRRTLVFGNWDAEEWTLTGSTEWGEEKAADLARNGVACLNVDSSCAGPTFQASAVPSLRRLISETLRAVPDPRSGGDLYAAALRAADKEAFKSTYNARVVEKKDREVTYDILGSGSDYTVFFNHLGMPSLDAGFDGPYGVYHSVLDDYFWMTHFGDPGFKDHTAMVSVWGILAYRLADADILPFEESPYARDARGYLDDVEKGARTAAPPAALPDLGDLRSALADWERAAADLDATIAAALRGEGRPNPDALARVNAALMKMERDLLLPAGLPKRPWFRHLIYAPLPSYAAETLPGLREAVADRDAPRAREQARALVGVIRARVVDARDAAEALAR